MAKNPLDDDVEGPLRLFGYGKARRPVAPHPFPGNILEDGPGLSNVFAESPRSEVLGELMAVPVTGDLIAAGGDLPDERGVSLRYPSQDEEGSVNSMPFKEFEGCPGRRNHP